MSLLALFACISLGISLGGNDGANIFGIAVMSKSLKYKFAVFLSCLFIVIGAMTGGFNAADSISSYAEKYNINSPDKICIVIFSVAFTVFIMTYLKMPVSTSQCLITAFCGANISAFHFKEFSHFLYAWLASPTMAFFITYILCVFFSRITVKAQYIKIINVILLIFNAYSLGANNTSNVTGILIGNMLNPVGALLVGSFSIALGIATISGGVVHTVGEEITKISLKNGLAVQFSCASALLLFSRIGIPVSSSQAIVGAVYAVAIYENGKAANFTPLKKILLAWFCSPLMSMFISYILFVATAK